MSQKIGAVRRWDYGARVGWSKREQKCIVGSAIGVDALSGGRVSAGEENVREYLYL